MPIAGALEEGAFACTHQARSSNRSLHQPPEGTQLGNTTLDSIRCQIDINPQKYIEEDEQLNNAQRNIDNKRSFLPALATKNYF